MRYSDVSLLSAKPKWLIQTNADLQIDEGFREFAYPDPLSVLGKKYRDRKYKWGFVPGDILLAQLGEKEEDGRPWTFGYGFTKGVKPNSRISKQAADRQLEQIVLDHIYILDKAVPNWKTLPDVYITVILNMAYNMGERLYQFKPTLNLISEGKFAEAGDRLQGSLWYRQVGDRAKRLIGRLKTGQIERERKVI